MRARTKENKHRQPINDTERRDEYECERRKEKMKVDILKQNSRQVLNVFDMKKKERKEQIDSWHN